MDETVHELEIRTKNAAGEAGTIYAEVTTGAKTPQGAAQEVMADLVRAKGDARVRVINETA